MQLRLLISLLLLACGNAFGVLRYVDNAATGANNGTSWANAWTNLNSVTGVGAGDTVYVSGGTTSKTYSRGFWVPPSGNSGAQFTLSVSTDAGHNGTVIFQSNNTSSSLFQKCNYVTINGRANGVNKMRVDGFGQIAHMDWDDVTFATGVKILGITTNRSTIRMYRARQVEIGWIIFEAFRHTGSDSQIIQGVGYGDNTGYGNNSIHDCEFYLYYRHGVDPPGSPDEGASGNDGIDWVGSIDIYNNKFIGVFTTGTAGGDHQDHILADGQYIRIWNNQFENAANYCVFGGFFGGNASDWQIWNNTFNYSDPVLTGQPTASIGIGSHVLATYSRFYIWNNTIRGGNRGISIAASGAGNTLVDCQIRNNIIYQATLAIQLPSGQGTTSNNTTTTSGIAFVNLAGGNFHLTSAATSAINQGITLTGLNAASANDKDGNARSVPWDIGAYEFGSVVGPGTIQLTASSYSVGEAGTSVTITASRVSGSAGAVGVSYTTSNGTAVSGSDYTTTAGTFSWADGITTDQSINVPITQDSDVEGNQVFDFTISSPTGGATLGSPSTAPVTIIDDEAPTIPLMGGLTFGAEEGLIESPFAVASGAIAQPTEVSDPALGGRARYRVTIPSTGDYRMEVAIDAINGNSNSFYAEWDAEPTEPADVSDIVSFTTGVQTRNVCGRGAGTFDNPQFNPRVWTLTAGVHTLYVRGRESSTEIDSFTVIALGVPPDTTAPAPDPMTWQQVPIAPGVAFDGITMTATLAQDDTGPIEYFFDETSGNSGGTDSDWQQSRTYVDTGLAPATNYTYRVKARDAVGTPNETAYSSSETAMTPQLEQSGVSRRGRGSSGRAITW